MKLRCDLHLGGIASKLLLVAKPEEKLDHLALKLAAYSMFLPLSPIVEPSASHASLTGLDLKPDVMALNQAGEIVLWIECGMVSIHKLDKLTRRFPVSRLLVLKSTAHEARQLRQFVESDIKRGQKIEILSWPDGKFLEWKSALAEKVEIFGEAGERHFNLVVNEHPFDCDLIEF